MNKTKCRVGEAKRNPPYSSANGRFPQMAGFRKWQVSANGRFPQMAGFRKWRVSPNGGFLQMVGYASLHPPYKLRGEL